MNNNTETPKEKYYVGQTLFAKDGKEGEKLFSELTEVGFYFTFRSTRKGNVMFHIYAHLSPTERDKEGFFVENNALREHLEYESMDAFGKKLPGHFFMTNQERGDSEKCLQFVKGKWAGDFWGDDKLYITPELFLYTNLEQAIRTVIPDFDVYGFDYAISREQWAVITSIDKGQYLKQAVDELAAWVDENTDPVMMILCM